MSDRNLNLGKGVLGGGWLNCGGCLRLRGALWPGLRECVLSRFAFDTAVIADAGSSPLVSHVKVL